MSSRTGNAKKNIIWGLCNKIVFLLLPFLNRTVLIYVLGDQYLGLDSLFTSILQMLNIAEIGFSSAIVFSMYEPIAKGKGDVICALLNFYRKVYRIIGIVVFGLGLILMPFLRFLIHSDVPQDVNLYVLYLICLLNTSLGYWLFSYKRALISAHQQERVLSGANLAINILKAIVQFSLVFIFKNYYLYIIITPIATVCENVVVELVSRKVFPQYVCRGKLDKDILQGISRRIKGLVFQKICGTSRNSLDNIVLSFYLGLGMVTIYGNYYAIMAGVHSMLSILTTSIAAGVGDGIARDSVEQNHQNMLKFDFMYMWLGGLCSIALLCLYQPAMEIWMGKERLLSFPVVCVISAYSYCLCMGGVRSLYTTGAGLWWEGRWRALAEAVANLVLNVILGKYFGVMGIIIATMASYIPINFFYSSTIVYRYYFKNGKIGKYYLSHLFYASVTLVAAMATYFVGSLFNFGNFGNILFRSGLCIVLPNLIYLLCYHRCTEFKLAVEFVRDMLGRKTAGKDRIMGNLRAEIAYWSKSLLSFLPSKFVHDFYYSRYHEGKKVNWSDPQTYDEKTKYCMNYVYDKSYGKYADKYLVRQYVEEVGLKDLLIPLIGVYDRAEDMDFTLFPDRFVLKATHGSGTDYYEVCRNKKEINEELIRKKFKRSLKRPIYRQSLERQYRGCIPRIVCEEMLTSDDGNDFITDYKVVCSNGKVLAILVCSDRYGGRDYFSTDWKYLEYTKIETRCDKPIHKPSCLEEMVKAAETLSNPFPLARIDFYESKGKLYFGEITLTPSGGVTPYLNDFGQSEIGKRIDISKFMR